MTLEVEGLDLVKGDLNGKAETNVICSNSDALKMVTEK